jgi:hypothetical protein
VTITDFGSSFEARWMTAADRPDLMDDQLDEDTTLGGPDLGIEVSEEVHSYQSVEFWYPRGNTASEKSGGVAPAR